MPFTPGPPVAAPACLQHVVDGCGVKVERKLSISRTLPRVRMSGVPEYGTVAEVVGSEVGLQVPVTWSAAAYPSHAGLHDWLANLSRRVAFVARWLARGRPPSVWLPGLFSPAAFLTAVLQRHSRMHGVALEGLTLGVEVLSRAAPPDAAGSQHTQQVRSSV